MDTGLKLDINPEVESRVWLLERQKTFRDYYVRYGDEIAERYEEGHVIIFPNIELDCDLRFLQGVQLPSEMKKIGTLKGIDRNIMVRSGNQIEWNPQHPLEMYKSPSDHKLYLYHQMVCLNNELRIGVRQLFPRYLGLSEGNITWRFTPTQDEEMHFDAYEKAQGKRIDRFHVKFFINIDSKPRIWRISHNLKHIITNCFDPRLEGLPSSLNDINHYLYKSNVLSEFPYHHIEWPQLSMILADGDVVSHQVLFGRRTIGVQFITQKEDMLDSRRFNEDRLRNWFAIREQNRPC